MSPVRTAEYSAPGSPGQRADFHAVGDAAYANEPAGTAPTPATVERQLAAGGNPGARRCLIAYRDDVPTARVVAQVSPALRDEAGRAVGLLSFFEAMDDSEAVCALFDAARACLRSMGARRMIGPMDGDTWHRYRVNAGPFTRPRFPLEPWNPAWYPALWEGAGFRMIESYSSKWIDDVGTLLPGLERGVQRSQQRGITIRRLDPARLTDELGLVHALSSAIFADAFLYTPIDRGEFLALYAGVERMLDPELVLFAEDASGTPVGFVFAYAEPARHAVHYKTIGVLADWRRAAVAAALSHAVYSAALRKGFPQGNHALMRDDNRSQALDQGLGEVFRRYLLYEWPG